ncbi:hypothetical protein T484DRAFT_1763452 [Baffinella frigidus]|nr:hypothetical protein T484DRAFT_1763452 [Cryptophyta sp. CCMP2293]
MGTLSRRGLSAVLQALLVLQLSALAIETVESTGPAAAAVLAMQGGGSSGGGGLFHVAPMQCYTNRHLRFLLRQLSSKAVLWTEMEKVETFMRSEEATRRTLRFDPSERPVVLQLGGDDAELLAAASRRGRL